jgi:hypothetical protein
MLAAIELMKSPAGAMFVIARRELAKTEACDLAVMNQFRLMVAPRLRPEFRDGIQLETPALFPLSVMLCERKAHIQCWKDAVTLATENPHLSWFFERVADERRVELGFPPKVQPLPDWTYGYLPEFCSGKDSNRAHSEENLLDASVAYASRPLLRKWQEIQKRMEFALDRHGNNLSASALDELRGHLIEQIAEHCWIRRGSLRKLRLPLEGELSRWASDCRRTVLFAGQTISQTYSLNRLIGEEAGTEFLDLLADPQQAEEATGVAIPATLLVVISMLQSQFETFNSPFYQEVIGDLLAGNFSTADQSGKVVANDGVFQRYCAKRTSWSAKLLFQRHGVSGKNAERAFAQAAFDQSVDILPGFLCSPQDRSLVIQLVEMAWAMPNLCYSELVSRVLTFGRTRVEQYRTLSVDCKISTRNADKSMLIAQCKKLDSEWEYYGEPLGTLWRAYAELLAHQCFEILREARFRCFSQTFQSLSDRLVRLRKQVHEYLPEFEEWLNASKAVQQL